MRRHESLLHSRCQRRRAIIAFTMLILAGACGGGSDLPVSAGSPPILDTTLDLVQGVDCNSGGVSVDFNGTLDATVTVDASGASTLTPQFVVYYPDYVRVLAGSAPNGAGKASLTVKLPEGGTYHISACDGKAVGGKLRIVVRKQS